MIETERLHLIPLTLSQLVKTRSSIQELAGDLSISIVSDLISGPVVRAVNMKIEKMGVVDVSLQDWFTYWLIVISAENMGVGMVGFKGYPNEAGAVEIGYGINDLFQSRGYMTEAVTALVQWAFSHPECRAVTANVVKVDNIASQKVLIKAGFKEISYNKDGISYIIHKD